MQAYRFGLLFLALTWWGCLPAATVTAVAGPLFFELSTESFEPPPELRDGNQVRRVPCTPVFECPSGEGFSSQCNAGFCDPDPVVVELPLGDVVDLDTLSSDFSDVLDKLDRIELDELRYDVELNSLTLDLEAIELFWGPESATKLDPAMGVRKLGTVPAIAAGQTGIGEVSLDAAGGSALSDFIEGGGRRIRLFGRTRVDLDPGDPFPEGEIRFGVVLTLTATGSL